MHPGWALVLMVGVTASFAAGVSRADYWESWRTTKFFDGEDATVLAIAVMCMLLGILVTAFRQGYGAPVATLRFTSAAVAYLHKAYKVLMVLTLIGYAVWAASAVAQGVSIADLSAVVDREPGAISDLKGNSRPIAGITTLTQFGPVAVVVGYLRRRHGVGGRWFLLVLALAAVRTVFYAERLALIEVAVPLVVAASLMAARTKRRPLIQAAPLWLVPLLWGVFAASEYTRSWIFYQATTSRPFHEWVTLRMLGYYTTAYNNSSLYASEFDGTGALPYSSVAGFWNAPILEQVFKYPGINRMPQGEWWAYTLKMNANPEFNNVGSFLVTFAELGWFMVIFWLLAGMMVGRVFASVRAASVPGFIAYCVLFVGILELPRFIYWTQGRALPIFLAVVVIAVHYRRRRLSEETGLARPHGTFQGALVGPGRVPMR